MTSHWPACADRFELFATRRIGTGMTHLHSFECLDDRFGDDEAGVLLVVGRDQMPRRLLCARRAQTGLVGHRVVIPVRSLSQVAHAQAPSRTGDNAEFFQVHFHDVGNYLRLPLSETAPEQRAICEFRFAF